MKIRLFIALDIPLDIRNFIIEERKRRLNGTFRWEPEEKLHITLKFIGNFPESELSCLKKELITLQSYIAIDLALTGFGFFPGRKSPRILWAGFSQNNILLNLVNDLNKQLVKFDIPVEEKLFKPHVTLLRIPGDRGNEIVKAFGETDNFDMSFISDRIILFQSMLLPKGSKYVPLEVYKLKHR